MSVAIEPSRVVSPPSSAPRGDAGPGPREGVEIWRERALGVLRATASCRSIDARHAAPQVCEGHFTCGKEVHTFELADCSYSSDAKEAARLMAALRAESDDFCGFRGYLVLSFSSESGALLHIYEKGCSPVFQW